MWLDRQRSPVLAEADVFRVDLMRSESLRSTHLDERIAVAGRFDCACVNPLSGFRR
jgi:hypothetical protein